VARIAVLAGDGIGPEVTACAQRVLAALRPDLVFLETPVGAAAIATHGDPLPPHTLGACEASDAILFGSVGGPGFDGVTPERRPEAGLLRLRKHFGLYANVRPSRVYAGLESFSPLRAERVTEMDLVIVRELTGGLYFGAKSMTEENGMTTARETLVYSELEIRRIVRFAFDLAMQRRKKLTSVDKNNVLISSQLWRRIVIEIAPEYPQVSVDHLLVDNAAMQLIREPVRFDVIVTENMFGDILSDEAAAITGSIGIAPSASLGDATGARRFGLYEPIAGTAPDIAGRGVANPVAAILSAALLARFSLDDESTARTIEDAIAHVLTRGPRTPDLTRTGEPTAGTVSFTDAIIASLAVPLRR
jgi:3-isopropylmalate dehydrogenase